MMKDFKLTSTGHSPEKISETNKQTNNQQSKTNTSTDIHLFFSPSNDWLGADSTQQYSSAA